MRLLDAFTAAGDQPLGTVTVVAKGNRWTSRIVRRNENGHIHEVVLQTTFAGRTIFDDWPATVVSWSTSSGVVEAEVDEQRLMHSFMWNASRFVVVQPRLGTEALRELMRAALVVVLGP